MILTINGREYVTDDVLARPTMNDLYALRLQTGLGLASLYEGLGKIDKLQGGVSNTPLISNDLEMLQAWRAFVWLVRRFHGEKLTVDEANDYGVDEFSVRPSPAEQEDETPADPSVPATGSAPAAAGRRAGARSGSKTSTRGKKS